VEIHDKSNTILSRCLLCIYLVDVIYIASSTLFSGHVGLDPRQRVKQSVESRMCSISVSRARTSIHRSAKDNAAVSIHCWSRGSGHARASCLPLRAVENVLIGSELLGHLQRADLNGYRGFVSVRPDKQAKKSAPSGPTQTDPGLRSHPRAPIRDPVLGQRWVRADALLVRALASLVLSWPPRQ
jgi:hypothetical protein